MTAIETTKTLPLAIQLYSVRSLLADCFRETLRALADIGFTAVELFGGNFGGMKPPQLADFLQSIGMKAAGMHFAPDHLLNPDSTSYAYARALQCEFVTVSMEKLVQEDLSSAVIQLQKADTVASGQGFVLTYHNHAGEFAELSDGRPVLDFLFEATDSFNMRFLFDVAFAFYAGYDPCDYLRRFQGRVPQIHFNDLAEPAGASVKSSSDSMEKSTELGTGCMDLPAIYRAAVETGVRWIILEQHTQRADPLESARRSFECYRGLCLDLQ